jgi:hypothetical protein
MVESPKSNQQRNQSVIRDEGDEARETISLLGNSARSQRLAAANTKMAKRAKTHNAFSSAND